MNEGGSENGLQAFVAGGLPQVLIGKHAADALGRIIFGIADIPVALLEGVSRRIRDDADGRSAVAAARATLAAEMVQSDPELSDRALRRWLGAEAKNQQAREAVAGNAFEDLQQEPSTAEEPPSEEFLARFERYAEGASTIEMQALFGRVLAGEIRRPGTFSLAALHIFSLMDQRLANTLQRLSTWLLNGRFLLRSGLWLEGDLLDALSPAIDLGLVSSQELRITLKVEADVPIRLHTRERVFFLALTDYDVHPFHLPVHRLTGVGSEVLSVVPQSALNPTDLSILAHTLGMLPNVSGVRSAAIRSLVGDQLRYDGDNMVEH